MRCNVNLTISGVTKPIEQWSIETGISVGALVLRKSRDWPDSKMLNAPKTKARMITRAGQTMCLLDWSKATRVSVSTIKNRLNHGWPIERLFDDPLKIEDVKDLADNRRITFLKLKQDGKTYEQIAQMFGISDSAVGLSIRKAHGKCLPCQKCGSDKSDLHHENYYPEKVVWLCRHCHLVAHGPDSKNRRLQRAKKYTFDSKTMSLPEWAKCLNVRTSALDSRIRYFGWSFEKAITTPFANESLG